MINKTSQKQDTSVNKAVYEKPKSTVYELEVEGAILQASGEIDDYDYVDPLS